MKKLFYFAYGSNMLLSRLQLRVGHITPVKAAGIHRLVGYKLVFNCGHPKFSYANIIPSSKEHCVEGVLYELTQRQISILNTYEGYPHNYEQEFFVLPDGNIGFAYVSNNDWYKSKALPEVDYLNALILGAYQNELYSTYNSLVSFKDQNYKLKKGNKFKRV